MKEPTIIFKGKSKNEGNWIEGAALMRDSFNRVFISDSFFPLGHRWIQVQPETVSEIREAKEIKEALGEIFSNN